MKTHLAVIGMALALAGCAEQQKRASLFEAVRGELDTELADYPSARFRNVRLDKKVEAICGQVNAKNAMGAFTGWTGFAAYGPGKNGQSLVLIDDISNPVGLYEDCGQPPDDWLPDDFSKDITARP